MSRSLLKLSEMLLGKRYKLSAKAKSHGQKLEMECRLQPFRSAVRWFMRVSWPVVEGDRDSRDNPTPSIRSVRGQSI